jgi:hypothetical protein
MSLILDQKNYVLEVLAVLSLGLLAKCHLADGDRYSSTFQYAMIMTARLRRDVLSGATLCFQPRVVPNF